MHVLIYYLNRSFNPNSVCYYSNNIKTWMNMVRFKDWLNSVNKKRMILVLVDNAGGHNLADAND